MKFLILSLFSLVSAYNVEPISTLCFFVDYRCHWSHAKDVDTAINRRPGEYISHSTTSTGSGMHSLIVYKS